MKPPEAPTGPELNNGQSFSVPSEAMTKPPEGAKNLHFKLEHVEIVGSTLYPPFQLQDVYKAYIHETVTLEQVYAMADVITKKYRDAGYFLSLAYVPKPEIRDGNVKIAVTEGYIDNVVLPEQSRNHIVNAYIDDLQAQKPVKASDMESFLLRMNDLPGNSYRAVLAAAPGAKDGVVNLTLVPENKAGVGSISFDNYSSRYLGPNEVSASYSTSLLPLQQTTISGLSSVPEARLFYGTLDHAITVAPNTALDLNVGVTKAYPGYTLQSYDIRSQSVGGGAGLTYQWIRQREQNLSVKFSMDSHDVTSDLLGTPLTRDHINALRAGLNYDVGDGWQGYNSANLTVSQGINWLGQTQKSDLNASRAGALPDFAKAELALSRLQGITDNWSAYLSASGQMSSGTLYSSEEFGYGGQAFGRAYDPSDITGDQGVGGSLELRYGRWSDLSPLSFQPYLFGDSGVVWNTNSFDGGRASGTSAGFGLRFATRWKQSGNLGLAWPLTRDISAPIYGGTSKSPRILVQVGQQF